MRVRRKPWARPELAACPFYIDRPAGLRGRWRSAFARPNAPLWLELGCGKGGFAGPFAAANPDVNLIAVDIKSEVLALAKRRADRLFAAAGRPVDNLLFLSQDIERIDDILAPEDGVERVVVNFCNPWPKPRWHKHRLTHTRQLKKYAALLRPGGELAFKTDDDDLFESTLEYLEEAGYALRALSRDLLPGHPACAYPSEHELMFRERGIPIKHLVAVPTKGACP